MKNVGNSSRGRSQGVMNIFRHHIGRIARSSLRQHSFPVILVGVHGDCQHRRILQNLVSLDDIAWDNSRNGHWTSDVVGFSYVNSLYYIRQVNGVKLVDILFSLLCVCLSVCLWTL